MAVTIFDGQAFAKKKEALLRERVGSLGFRVRLGSIVFEEDQPGLIFTRLKKQAALRVGIEFDERLVSLAFDLASLEEEVRTLSEREDIQGVLVQKPMKMVWREHRAENFEFSIRSFDDWWRRVVAKIPARKDVDCLTSENLRLVYMDEWQILPATVKAVLAILVSFYKGDLRQEGREGEARVLMRVLKQFLAGKQVVVVGRSELVGRPLAAVLRQAGGEVRLYGRDLDFEALAKADVVVSATGKPKLITGKMVKEGVAVVDVGSPKGDVAFEAVRKKAALITPVPGGVGPVTVVSLLENLVEVIQG